MKILIKRIVNTDLGIKFRNLIGFKPVHMSVSNIRETVSVSDAFCWRTDNSFTTTFKFSDLLDLFYKIKNSYVEIVIFDKKNNEMKRVNFKNLNLSNEFTITKELFNGIEDYGVFYIYHRFHY